MNKFWQFRNVSDDEGELLLNGPIASSKPWWADEGEGIYATQFAKDLKALGSIKNLTVRLNSGGGDVFAANAIYTKLKSHEATVNVVVEGIAASAATIIMAAADTVKAPSNALIMIHNPLAGLMGYYNKEDLEKKTAVLETVKDSILNAYVSKTARDREELSKMMDAETWMTAEEAKAEGFVDEILFEENVDASMTSDNRFIVVNSIAHDLSGFQSRPTLGTAQALISPPVATVPTPPPAAEPQIENKSKERENAVEIKNLDDLKKQYPEFCNELAKAAATAERERIKAIDDISATVADDLVNKAKYEEPITAQDLAFQALKADASKGRKFNTEREEELNTGNDVTANAGGADADKAINAAAIDAIAASMNQKRNKEVVR